MPSVLAHRGTQDRQGVYPVAKNNIAGSGSNKFCLAVLGWEHGTSRRASGWAGKNGTQLKARRPTLWEASRERG